MQPTFFVAFFDLSRTAFSMSAAGLAVLVIGLVAASNDVAHARGLDKLVTLANVCIAAPFATFAAEHFSAERLLLNVVPRYMPWRLFWLYFVGVALIAASLSLATKVQMRWSGLLLGIMMFLFVLMVFAPGAIASGNRFAWTVVFREMSFGGAAWVLAGSAMGDRRKGKGLIAVGRVLIAIGAIFFGVQHFLHPLGLPGVPLKRQMPAWIPGRAFIDYLTGAFLVAGGVCFLRAWKVRMAATYLGAWIVLAVVLIYGPVLIETLANPSMAVQVEGVSYFADTLLYGGAILSLARAMMSADRAESAHTRAT
jgi:uncharacterized membrane protein